MSQSREKGPVRNRRDHYDAIEWKEYPRIPPGTYRAYCKWGKHYCDPGFNRWTCLLRWDVLTDDLVRVIACVPQWFPLGKGERPHASRRGKYLPAWILANGGPPARRDRLSPNVFVHRIARVQIDDTTRPAPYSVVRRIIEWETRTWGTSISKYTSQDRSEENGVVKSVSYPCLSDIGDSARTGVEGENTPAHTQGAGKSATASPPKVEEKTESPGESDGLLIRCASVSDCNKGGCKDA